MATRMQQRRGTAAQWISTNGGNGPILAAGEIGFESDNNKFKIGDGVNHWIDLPYFSDNEALTNLIDGAPDLLNTLGELANALGDDPDFITTVATNLSNHSSDTTNVHGIANTADLATQDYVNDQIANSTEEYPELAGEGLTWDAGNLQFAVNTTLIQERVDGVSDTEIGYLSGVTSDIQTQINSKLASADLAEAAQEAVNTALVAGTGLDKTYDDLNNTITLDIDSTVATKSFAAGLLTGATKTNITITGNENGLTISAENGVADSTTSDLTEGTNLYFTNERAQDAVGNSVGTGLTYTDSTGEIKVTPDTYDAYGSASAVAGDLSTHASDTTDVHGIADTSLLATKAYADAAVAAAIDAAPENLNTLNELAAALADDANYATTVNNALATKAPLASPAFSGTVTGITKAMVGLGSVDNTADTAKPVSDATQTALNLKAPIDSPTFTGTIGGITKSMVGLGNVDNTSDLSKPVSTATQAELDLKAPLSNPTFTGTVAGITKSMVGLANVDNTTDANKPVSTATQTALDAKASLAGAVFTGNVEVDGNLVVDGNLTVNGTEFIASATSITIEDNMLQLAHENAANTVDLGLVVGYNDGTAKHAGIVRDASANKWKLFEGVTTEPTTTVDFTQGSLDDLQVAGFEATSATIGDVSNTELQYLNGVTSGIQSQLDAKLETSTASSTYATIANVDLKAPLANPTFTGTVAGVTKTHVGLGNVDNTSDADKPVSSAAQSALDLKAPIASPTFTGTVILPTGTVTSGMILDGTIVDGDISSSAAIAQSKVLGLTTDLGLKAPLESPALTGTPTAPTATAGTNTTQVATTAFVGTAVADLVASAPAALNTLNELATALGNDASFSTTVTNSLAAKAPLNSPTFTGTVSGISKSMVGLANVDNTSDVSKPVSNATQTALDAKIAKADISAKGVILVGTGTGTYVAQTVGTNGQVLTANSAQTDGVEWTTLPVTSEATPTTLGTVYGLYSESTSNVGIGKDALNLNGSGAGNTAMGKSALQYYTTGAQNSAFGAAALKDNTTGSSNTSVGHSSLFSNTTGSNNTANGFKSLESNTTGFQNVAVGFNSLSANTTGAGNTVLGASSLINNTVGEGSVAIGSQALLSSASTDWEVRNTAVGSSAGSSVTTGKYNTLIGYAAGVHPTFPALSLTTGSNNIIIGTSAAPSSATASNEITLGRSSISRFRVPGLGIDWTSSTVPTSLPSQSGNTGKFLTTNGSSALWQNIPMRRLLGTINQDSTNSGIDATPIVFEGQQILSIEYVLTLRQNQKIRTSKIIVHTDGTTADFVEFSILELGGSINGLSLSASIVGSSLFLFAQVADASSTNVFFNGYKTEVRDFFTGNSGQSGGGPGGDGPGGDGGDTGGAGGDTGGGTGGTGGDTGGGTGGTGGDTGGPGGE